MKLQSFEQINIGQLRNALVLLDVDGALVADGESEFTPEVVARIQMLQQHNTVFFCTNGPDTTRNQLLEQRYGVTLLNHQYKKPNPRILEELPEQHRSLSITVIGDKFLTDGIFARRIGAAFIKVQRKTNNDRITVRLINIIDDVLFFLSRLWGTRT